MISTNLTNNNYKKKYHKYKILYLRTKNKLQKGGNNNKIKMMSWNILSDTWINPHYYKYEHVNGKYLNMDYRYERNKYIIKQNLPDLITLQEVHNNIYEKLKNDFGKDYIITPLHEHDKLYWSDYAQKNPDIKSYNVPNGNVILLKKSYFGEHPEGYTNKTLKISENGNHAGIVEIKDYLIINIHIDWPEKEERNEEVNNLTKYIKDKPSHIKVILAGDFNASMDKTNEFMFLQNYNNLYVQKDKYSYFFAKEQLDYIYVSDNLIQTDKQILNNIPDVNITDENIAEETIKYYGSDHYPLLSTIVDKN